MATTRTLTSHDDVLRPAADEARLDSPDGTMTPVDIASGARLLPGEDAMPSGFAGTAPFVRIGAAPPDSLPVCAGAAKERHPVVRAAAGDDVDDEELDEDEDEDDDEDDEEEDDEEDEDDEDLGDEEEDEEYEDEDEDEDDEDEDEEMRAGPGAGIRA